MKKIIYSVGAVLLLGFSGPAYAETATGTSAAVADTTAQSSSQTAASSSSSAESSSSNTSESSATQTSESSQDTAATNQTDSQTETKSSTTTQNDTNNVEQNQTQTAPAVGNTETSHTKASSSESGTKNSTTIINETVNNNSKGTNALLMTLTGTSATFTIIGGVTAFVRHLRKKGKGKGATKGKQKNRSNPAKDSTAVKNRSEDSLTASSVTSGQSEPSTTGATQPLSETSQLNMQADAVLKKYKKEKSFSRRRR